MDHSSPPSTEVQVADFAIPLTQFRKDGTPYERYSDVEAQIVELISTDPSKWEAANLKSETLVHLIRWLWKKGDKQNIGRLIECLGRRIAQIAGDFARGFKKPTAEDFAIEIACDINEQIFAKAPTRQSEFLEIAFRQAIQRRAINKRAVFKERLKNEVTESSLREIDTDDGPMGIVESHPGDFLSPEDAAILAEQERMAPERIRLGLAAISDPRHREAVVLRYLKDWPISDENPQTPTLSTRFAMSPRQVHNWLVTAIKEMRTALGEPI